MADTAETPDTDGTATATQESASTDRRASREQARLTRAARSFAAAHGGSAEGQIAYLGARGYRLVLVGADGGWGDLVTADREHAVAAAAEAGVTLQESFDGELAARVRTGPYEWSRMAGSQLGGPSDETPGTARTGAGEGAPGPAPTADDARTTTARDDA
ncbi:hypothetical protein [Streptomyces sp. SM14]|uniref:hypothetical protein n=1 Tax=Streptomyces sp. SM14 TaxID=1736045 RepID=UPI0027E471DA|nr:hypothetical protein [Streptomyces sp. SM14]